MSRAEQRNRKTKLAYVTGVDAAHLTRLGPDSMRSPTCIVWTILPYGDVRPRQRKVGPNIAVPRLENSAHTCRMSWGKTSHFGSHTPGGGYGTMFEPLLGILTWGYSL